MVSINFYKLPTEIYCVMEYLVLRHELCAIWHWYIRASNPSNTIKTTPETPTLCPEQYFNVYSQLTLFYMTHAD